jgi:LAS superfamily LD-carboxypeptidase LdcB
MPHFVDSRINENVEVATEYFKALVSQKDGNKVAAGSIGFIPFNMSFTMDGISGIKIYNELSVDTSFLPPGYTKTTDFIVTGVDHKIQNGDWETSITTTLIPRTSPINNTITSSLSFTSQTEEARADTAPQVNTPTGTEGGNGRLPESALKSVGGIHKLAIEAADAYLRMVEDMKAEGLTPVLGSSYRTYEVQTKIFDWEHYVATGGFYNDTSPRRGAKRRKLGTANTAAAFPGTSNHGWGKAIDISPKKVQDWIKQNGVKYGWSWYEGKSVNENWHFTYDPSKTEIYV